jgi:hypothetical protein
MVDVHAKPKVQCGLQGLIQLSLPSAVFIGAPEAQHKGFRKEVETPK